jgi:MFS transporter, Spinster family, sphingosine-1-phosphate transporter
MATQPSKDVDSAPPQMETIAAPGIWLILATLFACNLLNYIDRNLLPGAQPLLQKTLGITDSKLGALSSSFFAAYMLAAPLLGWLGDKVSRRLLVLISVVWWSCALGLATFSPNIAWFRAAYSMVAVGEAAFGVYAVTLLSDYFPGADRTRALSLFLLAITAGRAIGYPIAGWSAETLGWQAPFRICALAGLLLTLVATRTLPDTKEQLRASLPGATGPALFRALSSRPYIFAVLGLAMHTFSLSGLSIWLPTYLHRFAGYSVSHATAFLGAVTLVCGLGGTWLGGILGERFLRRDRRALYWLSAASLLLAIPCVAGLLLGSPWVIAGGVMGAEFFLALNLGPLNTAVLNSVPIAVRSTAVAAALFVVHALGDVPSPRLIGAASDAFGLHYGMSITLVSLLAGSLLLFAGAGGASKLHPPE